MKNTPAGLTTLPSQENANSNSIDEDWSKQSTSELPFISGKKTLETKKSNASKTLQYICLEVIALLLSIYFFQDAIYKIAYRDAYVFWLQGAPYLHTMPQVWKYFVPAYELVVFGGLLFHKGRKPALYMALVGLIATMIQILAACIFSHHIFFPYHFLWFHIHWFGVLLADMVLAWSIFLALSLLGGVTIKKTLNSPVQDRAKLIQ